MWLELCQDIIFFTQSFCCLLKPRHIARYFINALKSLCHVKSHPIHKLTGVRLSFLDISAGLSQVHVSH